MPDEIRSPEELLEELRLAGEAIAKLAENEELFKRAYEANREQDADNFQAVLIEAGLLQHCRLICRWFCTKHCTLICSRFCGHLEQQEVDLDEIREFAAVSGRLAQNEELLEKLIDIFDREDVEAWQAIIDELQWHRYCHQLCHWICAVRCRRVCWFVCPPPPWITKVGLIPTPQIDAQGYAAGPSSPPGPTPPDNKPAGAGDHPFGGLTNIRGIFNVAGATEYRVEFRESPGGTWTPISTTIEDWQLMATPPYYYTYNRTPTGGWYKISEMGLLGTDYLTDWHTPNVANGTYDLRLTVRNAAMTEFFSPVVKVKVDNVAPTKPVISLQLQEPDGTRRSLGCCEEVKQGDGNLIVVTLQASDANFSNIAVRLMGGCGVSLPIVATDGTPLSKSYNGDLTDTGYPVPAEFLWDPWGDGVDPCCYLVHVQIWDRAIVNNAWSNGHSRANWHSITIA